MNNKYNILFHKYFDFLLTDFHFIVYEESSYFVNYKKGQLVLLISYDYRSYELNIAIQHVEISEYSFDLKDIFEALNIPMKEFSYGCQYSDFDDQEKALMKMSNMLKKYGDIIFNLDRKFWSNLNKSFVASQISTEFEHALKKSNEAWQNKDYKMFVNILIPWKLQLDKLNAKRFIYSEKHLNNK